jgi:beta-lactamase regulating signal transducer with metallopeptidase domain
VTLGGILPHLLWQGALVGAATAIALRLAGPAASNVRYRLALGALVLIAVAPPTTLARRAGWLADWGFATTGPPAPTRASPARDTTSLPIELDRGRTSPAAHRPEDQGEPPSPLVLGRELFTVLGVLWAIGVVWLLARLAGGIARVSRVRGASHPAPPWIEEMARDLGPSTGVRRAVPVLLSDRTDIPFASGVLRPAIVLPDGLAAELSPGEIRVVLAHELAHVGRHDYAVNLGQRVVEALLLFHPVVYWLSKVARDEREHCCDERVAAVVGDRRTVAGTLLALEEARGGRGAHRLLPAAAGGALLRRVERLLVRKPTARPRWAVAALAVLLTGGGTMVIATPAGRGPTAAIGHAPASAGPRASEGAGQVVWMGELRDGEWLRVRNVVGSIRVVRATGQTGVIRASLSGPAPSDLSFQATRQDDGVTVCALRAEHGRCDSEGYTWFGAPAEMERPRIELTVELPPGVSVAAATFDGDLDLDGIDADAEARTGSGAIAARIVDPPESRSSRTLDLHTGDGTVRVELPPAFGGALDARLSSGRVVSEPPLDPSGVVSDHELQASLGPGGDRLRVSSGMGDLVLTRSR